MAKSVENVSNKQREASQDPKAPAPTSSSSSYSCCRYFSRCFVGFILVPMAAYFVPIVGFYAYSYFNQVPYAEYLEGVKHDLFPKRNGTGISGVDISKFKTHVKVGDTNLLSKILKGTNTSGFYHNTPYIFYKSDVRKWKALRWDMWNISEKWYSAQGIISSASEDRNIVIESERDRGGMLGRIDTKLVSSYLFAEFLNWSKDKNESKLYIADYDVFENKTKTTKHTRWRDLIIREPAAVKAGVNDSDAAASYIWMLYPNTSVQCKYTAYHTMRAQIKGNSYIALFPPEYTSILSPYPNLHVSYGQSQLEYVEEDAYRDKKVQHVLMKPGDLLYIPPFWNVRPRSLETMSIGIDIISASIGQLSLLEAFYMNLPFDVEDIQREDPQETKRRRIVAAQIFLLHFMSKLCKNSYKSTETVPLIPDPAEFVKKLYETRYSGLFPEDSLLVQSNDFKCFRDEADKYKEIYRGFIGSNAREGSEMAIEKSASFAAKCVNEPVVEDVVKVEWMYDYMEHMARWAMGTQDEAVFFLRECFNVDFKLYKKLLEKNQEVEGPSVLKFGEDKGKVKKGGKEKRDKPIKVGYQASS